MADTLDLAILDAGKSTPAVVFARCGSDVAVSTLPFGAELDELLSFRTKIDKALRAIDPRPSSDDLDKFGEKLFKYIMQGEVEDLYKSLPKTDTIRLSILSNRADLKSIPWEYFWYPEETPGPLLIRPVVRIVPTRKGDPPEALPLKTLGRKLKILFAFADPSDLDPTNWMYVRDAAVSELKLRLPEDTYDFIPIDANPKDLFGEIQDKTYDIFHYSGHADVDAKGVGQIFLPDRVSHEKIPFSSAELCGLLRNRGIRLVILSACNTSAGNFQNKFDVIAEALVRSGIPAVVANQFPFPDSTMAEFVQRLYKTLLTTGDIDKAVNEGRISLYGNKALGQGKSARLEWGVPTLYRHIAGSKVFVT